MRAMKLDLVIELTGAAAQVSASHSPVRMPMLETLIARGDPFQPPAVGCDECLIALFGHDPAVATPNAALRALGEGLAPGTDYWLRADPVSLAPTTAHLTLTELAEDSLTAAEAQALLATLNAHFAADDLVLFAPHPQRWYVRSKTTLDLKTLSPADCAGTLQESVLPAGRDGARWKRTITEAQMLLHAHPVNMVREDEGKAPANAIWPWGGGGLPLHAGSPPFASVWSDDPLVRGLGRLAGIATHALPPDVRELLAKAPEADPALVVIRIRHSQAANALASLEEHWLSPLRAAIAGRQISELSISVFGGRAPISRHVTRSHLRRWWRRNRALNIHG